MKERLAADEYNPNRLEISDESKLGLHPIKHAANIYLRGYRTWTSGIGWWQVNKKGARLYVTKEVYRLMKHMEKQDA